MSEEVKNDYECPTVKIPDARGMIVFEFENKGSIICPAEGIWKAVQKYMTEDMTFVRP